MNIIAKNPTAKGKAVRTAGGLTVIEAGKSLTLDADWTDEELARYTKAGLVISEVKEAKAKPAPTKAKD